MLRSSLPLTFPFQFSPLLSEPGFVLGPLPVHFRPFFFLTTFLVPLAPLIGFVTQ